MKVKTQYKNLKEDVISELWELSVRDDFSSFVDSGENKGKRLIDVLTDQDIGPIKDRFPYFPLLDQDDIFLHSFYIFFLNHQY